MNASQIVGTIIINNNSSYDCFYIDQKTTGNQFVVVVKAVDFNKVKSDFSSITSLEIYDDTGTLTKSLTKYTTVSAIETRFGVYMDDLGGTVDAYRITLKAAEIEEMVKKLDEKVFPVVDYGKMSIDEFQDVYIQKTKEVLNTYLLLHPLTSSVHGGKLGVYSVTKDKQDLMASNYLTYSLKKQIDPNAVLTWNQSGKECEVWTEPEFVQLILEVEQYVKPLVSHQQALESKIRSLTDKTEIMKVEIDYEKVNP